MAGPDPRQRIDALFEQALDLAPGERAAFLDRETVNEPSLRVEVEELLRLVDADVPALDPEALRSGALYRAIAASRDHDGALSNGTQQDEDASGHEVGQWRLLRRLGHGGMGTVYLAERTRGGFQQSGALKRLHLELGSSEFLRRFEQERQILASLNYPGIARLLDGGRDGTGRPYLVMEYVEGEPLDAWCDARKLDVGQRLELFTRICEAVAHAHRHLIVHRDIKPSNTMVTADGEVKLLDFGVAKVLGETGTPVQPLTRTAVRVFTPEYAAPEQVRDEQATTATDVYQLGLLLYELLTGKRAQTGDGPVALQRAICETEPPRPSQAIGDDIDVAAARGTTPAALRRRLRGDLDNIVLKALRKEPERRYASAAALVDDIERWRQRRPVQARPERFAYRTGKFVRRHPFGVAASAMMLAMLVAYAATVTRQAATIAHERDRAQAEATKARQVQALVLRLFENADPQQSGGSQLSARELLDRGWAGIEAELGNQPEVRLELLDTVAEAYRQLGLYDHAQPLLDASVESATKLRETQPELLARALRSKGRLRSDQGDYTEAERLLQDALVAYQRIHVGAHADIADTLRDLGLAALRKGEWQEAERLYRQTLAMRRQLFGGEHLDVADSLDQLGVVIRHQGDYATAEPLLSEALALRRRLLPANHPLLARSLSNLAVAHNDLGRYDSAEALYREALTLMTRSHGERHHRVAAIKNNLARLLQVRRDYPAAVQLLREALDIRREAFGERHPNVALNLNDLARLLAESGDRTAAEAYYQQALAAYPPDHPWRAATVFNLGLLAEEQGDFAIAERHYRDALEQQRRDYGADHDRVGTDLTRLGVVLHRQGHLDEAESRLRQALVIYRKRLPEGHHRLATVLLPLGVLLLEHGRHDEAEPLLHEAWTVNRTAFGDNDERTIAAAHALARTEQR